MGHGSRQRSQAGDGRARRALGALVVLLLGLTVVAALATAGSVRANQRQRFDSQAQRLDAALAERLTAYEQVLRGGLGLFEGSEDVTQSDWVRYVDTLQLPDRYPGFKSLSYAPAVASADLAAFVDRARDGWVDGVGPQDGRAYELRSPPGSRGTPVLHAPILYVAPDTVANWPVLGIDMMREPTRRVAMERAAELGTAVASTRVRLSGSASDEAGFIVYVPVRRDGVLMGWLTSAFLAEAFMEGLGDGRATDLDYEILDGTGSDARLLHSSATAGPGIAPVALSDVDGAWRTSTSTVDVPGGEWSVRYVARDAFVPWWPRLLPWVVALVGLLVTGFVLAVGRAGERWHRLAVALDEQSQEARAARDAAEAATLAKSTFLATMSHEIRTPLTAVLGANSVLRETDLDAEQASYVGVIHDGGRHLLHVVNEILDLSKAEAGRVVLEDEPFDLDRCVATVLDLVGTDATRRGVHLTAEQGASAWVVGDVARLRQVLLNLVANAVKFTPEGGRVTLDVVPAPDDDLVVFEVADTGIGIAPDQLAGLFDPYVQAGTGTTRTHGGTGLGLSIARRLVEAMGGSIQVDSTVGVGTTFRFAVRLPHAPPAPAVVAAPPPEPRRLRVLVAEDDATSQELLGAMLDLLGHDADLVDDGAAAVEAAAASTYDVVLLDRHMPGLDGLDAARQLRDRSPGVRIVAISGSVGPDGGFGTLADDVVAKPFTLDDLAAALARVPDRVPVTPLEDQALLR